MKYRLVKGIGRYWNERWEIQERYQYYDKNKRIIAWHTICVFSDKQLAEEHFKYFLQGKVKGTKRIIADTIPF